MNKEILLCTLQLPKFMAISGALATVKEGSFIPLALIPLFRTMSLLIAGLISFPSPSIANESALRGATTKN